MAYTTLKYGEKLQKIKKSYLRCAHIQAHRNALEQTGLIVSNSHNIFKCQ
jgi:hypothetical protein